MFWQFLAPWLSKKFDWLQVEVTSHCNAACFYCSHTVYRQVWRSRHLPWATFQKLAPELSQARLIHLQGWGEPLLNPELLRMLSLAKQQGCQVSLTTNGMLLDPVKIEALVAAGLDILAFSLAGLGDNNNRARRGTDYDQVLKTIRAVQDAKQRHYSPRPALHLAYMVLRSSLADLTKLPEAISGLGLSQVVLSTLDFVGRPELRSETITPEDHSEYQELHSLIAELKATAPRFGLQIHSNIGAPAPRRQCPENILRACFVAADGQVSPCVFTNLPVAGVQHLAAKTIRPYANLVFGNLNSAPLGEIWESGPYREFRRRHRRGALPIICQGCRRLLP